VAEHHGSGLEAPDERAIDRTQAIDLAILATEEHAALPIRRRRVDAATGDELLGLFVCGDHLPLIISGLLSWNNWKQLRNEPQIPWMNAR
jgi:hypothetical protein